jgi:hypothetical protein
MRYMMFIKHKEDFTMEDVPRSLFPAMGEFVEASMKSGKIVETAGLQPTAKATSVRLSGGKLKVTDGPFAEAKEVVGGFAIVEAKSKAEAIELATQFMELHRVHWPTFEGECEVRQYEDVGEAPK